jgi:hypothetical protein
MHDDSLLDWLRPSALEGAWTLAAALRSSDLQDMPATVRLLSTTYSSAGFDFDAAQHILREIPAQELDRASFFRIVFWEAMVRARPAVLALTPRGRAAFSAALPQDAAECLRRCGVLDIEPDVDAVRWFDRLTSLARSELDQRSMEAAREAERRSLGVEAARLQVIAGAPAAEWVALDDNALGYDIRSFDQTDGKFLPKLIEVKACASGALEFHLTRNECSVARREPERYWLHLWNLRSGILTEVRWPDIEPLVPLDTERGQWTDARIRWGSLPR